MADNRITPDRARVRFGELLGIARTHRAFEAEEGLWRPVPA